MPKIGAGHVDQDAMGIKAALNVPKSSNFVNEQIRPGGKSQYDSEALAIKTHLLNRENRERSGGDSGNKESSGSLGHDADVNANGHAEKSRNWGRYDSSALHIQHALKQTAIQKQYHKPHAQAINSFLVSFFYLNRLLQNNTYLK